MSDWFASVPHAFDVLGFATRVRASMLWLYASIEPWIQFQIESLASEVRYYKRKYSSHRTLIERLKVDAEEVKELKRYVEPCDDHLLI